MENILISACLLGCKTRYNGTGKQIEEVQELLNKYNLIPVCPEQLGGLATPRYPAEQRNGRVIDNHENDLTEEFTRGAEEVLKLAKLYNCTKAILKERSPSCGYGEVYDGTFSGTKIKGNGVTAGLLADNGIQVYGESDIKKLCKM